MSGSRFIPSITLPFLNMFPDIIFLDGYRPLGIHEEQVNIIISRL